MKRQFISFPKSGRTWVRYALHILGADRHIKFHHDGFEYSDGSLPPLDFDFERRLNRSRHGKIVYMHRDPRDVMASLYAQITGRFRDYFSYSGTPSEFIRHPYFGARNLFEFQRQWDTISKNDNILRVTYEDCHADFASVLTKILNHFTLATENEQIVKAAEMANIDNMRFVEKSEQFPHPWLRPRNGSPKVRFGVVGGYRQLFNDDDVAYLERIFFQAEQSDLLSSARTNNAVPSSLSVIKSGMISRRSYP